MADVSAEDWTAQPIDHPALEAHYRDVTSFQAERIRRSIRSSRLAWSVAGAAMLANIGLSVAVAAMLPLVMCPPNTDVTNSAFYRCHWGRAAGGRGAPAQRSARPAPVTRTARNRTGCFTGRRQHARLVEPLNRF
jgi:hypothetical protein